MSNVFLTVSPAHYWNSDAVPCAALEGVRKALQRTLPLSPASATLFLGVTCLQAGVEWAPELVELSEFHGRLLSLQICKVTLNRQLNGNLRTNRELQISFLRLNGSIEEAGPAPLDLNAL